MLTVYTRHHPECKNAGDKTWRRCNCPKWIWGSLNGKFIRQSAKTHSWEVAEELRRQLSEGAVLLNHPAAEIQSIPIASAPLPVQVRNHPVDSVEEILGSPGEFKAEHNEGGARVCLRQAHHQGTRAVESADCDQIRPARDDRVDQRGHKRRQRCAAG